MRLFLSLLIGAWFGGVATGHTQGPSGPSGFLQVRSAYGSLAFSGVVERVDLGEDYEYRAVMAVTFLADAEVNGVSSVALKDVRLVATALQPPNPRVTVLHEERQTIAVNLIQDRQAQWLPPFVFRLDKPVEASAHHVGLAVSDGRLLWPVSIELKSVDPRFDGWSSAKP